MYMYQKCQYVFDGLRHLHLLLQLTISEVDSKYHLSDTRNEIMNKRNFSDRNCRKSTLILVLLYGCMI